MGYKMYEPKFNISAFRSTAEEFFTERSLASYMSDLQHNFTSAVGRCESYNDFFRDSKEKEFIKKFLSFNTEVGGHFQRKNAEELIEDQEEDEEDEGKADKEEEVDEIEPNSTLHLMGRKNLSTAFYNHQVYLEMNERKHTDQVIFGPKENPQDPTQSISHKESLEDYMRSIDSLRRNELYEHTSSDCSGPCRRRGCGKLASIDGKHSCKNVKISTKQSFNPKNLHQNA